MAEEEKKENCSETKKCRCAEDLRTFIIALLTSIIVVLAFQGILMVSKCYLKCRDEAPGCKGAQCCMMMRKADCAPANFCPDKPGHKFHKHPGAPDGKRFKKHKRPEMPAPADAPAAEAAADAVNAATK